MSLVLNASPGPYYPCAAPLAGEAANPTFAFDNLKENVGLADKEFAFKIPRGVDVVESPRI